MRCLYCGNELALLKKLTGGGEFCSEGHRQKYQEEYNRLALSRLLQAQSPPDETAVRRVSSQRPAASAVAAPPAQEKPPAPPAGLLPLRPGVVSTPPPLFQLEEALPQGATPSIPQRIVDGGDVLLAAANPVTYPLKEPWDCLPRNRERQLEVREFGRAAPSFEFGLERLQPKGLSYATDFLDAPVQLRPPQGPMGTWSAPESPFAGGVDFAEFTHLDFVTTGLELPPGDGEVPEAEPAVVEAAQAAEVLPEPVQVETKAPDPPQPEVAEEPAVAELPEAMPVFAEPAEPEVEEAPAAVEAAPLPRQATGTLPVQTAPAPPSEEILLHDFSAIPITSYRLHLPRVSAIPLRPLMTLGPAPKVEDPAAATKELPSTVAARLAQVRQELKTPQASQAEKRPEIPARAAKEPEPAMSPAEPRTTNVPRTAPPHEAPATPPPPPSSLEPDLPMLSLMSQPASLWGRMPMASKIAAVIALILAVGLMAYLGKGSSAVPPVPGPARRPFTMCAWCRETPGGRTGSPTTRHRAGHGNCLYSAPR